MKDPTELQRLAELLVERNECDRKIARLIARPATVGNIGEYVASRVFQIRLVFSESQAGYDGVFQEGPFAGRTVNIKSYSRHQSIRDVGSHPCDFYLVLTGPRGAARHLPWGIESVFLFESTELLGRLKERGVKIGVATSVTSGDWEAARVFPPQPSSPYALTGEQLNMLSTFAPQSY
jgi:hypothetical protein